ncbi:MAG: tetratricopeptide repeat protein [Desulfonauticus sp.]|nr:tetratricopeptide repeat protein [Desulfonauticus sp.]
MKRWWLFLLIGLLLLSGCLPNGKMFLAQERYAEGIRIFQPIVQKQPNNPKANYYLGRFYLAQKKVEKAIPYLKRAVQLDPNKAEYHFWLGVAYWAVRNFSKERQCYLQALQLQPKFLPARLYLGHNYFDSGEWKKALTAYNEVLKLAPYNPEALYNRALVFHNLKQPQKELQAWKTYLKYYPRGRWAIKAVEHLNALGDFSYRNFLIGYRLVPLKSITFIPGTDTISSQAKSSLNVIGNILSINKRIVLRIDAYVGGNINLAQLRAKAVRKFLLQHFPEIAQERLKYKAYGKAERIQIKNKEYYLAESIDFVTLKR